MKTIQIDVLVVGAGGAGLRAAIEAKEQGVSVFWSAKKYWVALIREWLWED